MNLNEIRDYYVSEGYDFLDASSKTCQDVILLKIAKSKLSRNVAIKGGVIIQYISKDKRRATRDFDIDFIKYSLADDSIKAFIGVLNDVDDGIEINITAPIEELSHQEYRGKRANLVLVDQENNKIETKLDIGVHTKLDIEQEEYCFEINSIDENVILFMNSKEQVFSEKLRSLLKLGRFSTRYKDLFDFYYFIEIAGLNKDKLKKCITDFILEASDMREVTIEDILVRLRSIFESKDYLGKASRVRNNWLDTPMSVVTDRIESFFSNELS